MLIVDRQQWKDHLLSMDHLKEGIGLRGYGQRDPLTEYKKEAFDIFQEMVERVKDDGGRAALQGARGAGGGARARAAAGPRAPGGTATAAGGDRRCRSRRGRARAAARAARDGQKVGRNDPCPCGSGKKYKKCCLLKGG